MSLITKVNKHIPKEKIKPAITHLALNIWGDTAVALVWFWTLQSHSQHPPSSKAQKTWNLP